MQIFFLNVFYRSKRSRRVFSRGSIHRSSFLTHFLNHFFSQKRMRRAGALMDTRWNRNFPFLGHRKRGFSKGCSRERFKPNFRARRRKTGEKRVAFMTLMAYNAYKNEKRISIPNPPNRFPGQTLDASKCVQKGCVVKQGI